MSSASTGPSTNVSAPSGSSDSDNHQGDPPNPTSPPHHVSELADNNTRIQYKKTPVRARSPQRNRSPVFTKEMQDRQARDKYGKPYGSDTEDYSDDDDGYDARNKRFDAYGTDSYANVERRRTAALVLDSPELLMMHAAARSDSIPGTRHYFTKMLCGYHDPEDHYPLRKPDYVAREGSSAKKGNSRR